MRDAWFAAAVIGLGFAMVSSVVAQLLFLSVQFADIPETYEDDLGYEERYMEIVLPQGS